MRRRWLRLLPAAALCLLLAGCLFRPPDELYRRPEKSAEYGQLAAAIQSVRSSLEVRFNTACEDAVIVSGDNTASIQLQDLDGDGVRESALVFLRVPGVEKALKIFVFTETDGEYRVSGVVEGEGSSIYSVDYADLNGEGHMELVVSWQISTGVYQLGAYTLDELDASVKPSAAPSTAGENGLVQTADWSGLRATELLLTTCSPAVGSGSYSSGYALLDIDQDSRTEIAVVHLDSAGMNSEVEICGWREGAFVSLDRTGLSAGAVALNRVRPDSLGGDYYYPALYVTSTLEDGSRAVDVLACQDREGERKLTNLSLPAPGGVSRNLLQSGMDISPTDIDRDTVLELPDPSPLPSYGDSAGGTNFWLIDWGQYTDTGAFEHVMTTYHNSADGWYLEIPESWRGKITISRNDSLSGQRQVDFSLWMGEETAPEPFLSICRLTGSNRFSRSESGGRFVLREEGGTIYAARFYNTDWDCGLDETSILNAFQTIQTSWYG